jgi:hypothetical protein
MNKNNYSDLNELYNILKEVYPELKEREKLYDSVKDIIYNYPKQHKMGFTNKEIDILLKENYPNINMDKFNNALKGVTMMIDQESGETLIYDIDIVRAIVCDIENRDLTAAEWD